MATTMERVMMPAIRISFSKNIHQSICNKYIVSISHPAERDSFLYYGVFGLVESVPNTFLPCPSFTSVTFVPDDLGSLLKVAPVAGPGISFRSTRFTSLMV